MLNTDLNLEPVDWQPMTGLWCYYTYTLYILAIYSYILNRQYYMYSHISSMEAAMKLEQKPECS